MKLSFKKDKKETGLAGVANPFPLTFIKGDKKLVGYIHHPRFADEANKWYLMFMVKDQTQRSGWKWITLTARFDSEEQGREFVMKHWNAITTKYSLHQQDDD
jgi:hypothetical protein